MIHVKTTRLKATLVMKATQPLPFTLTPVPPMPHASCLTPRQVWHAINLLWTKATRWITWFTSTYTCRGIIIFFSVCIKKELPFLKAIYCISCFFYNTTRKYLEALAITIRDLTLVRLLWIMVMNAKPQTLPKFNP